ncbi:hypothetical protein C9374_007781 [Naegleria lovaniensis]|uniref:Uncharacterized protein n=1 Tax=Naegleria lovaniensis TaxID=51637 RepID=A0AA88GIC8_NAELO|nr:uncharacterized protein C9374_007781 [Naegleria lovaniensis]KAG2379143.1 hypothetical protein C9374_007781 [Naegleria lovaniensis]
MNFTDPSSSSTRRKNDFAIHSWTLITMVWILILLFQEPIFSSSTDTISAFTTTTTTISASSPSGLSFCAIANTSLIPLTATILDEQQQAAGIQCPFGFIKREMMTMTSNNSAHVNFACVRVMDLLNEIVDRKDCEFEPSSNSPGMDELDGEGPNLDLTNCVFDFLHCSPRTRKCTFTNTRAQGDACVDRYSCVGSLQQITTNCHEGRCTTMKPNPTLPVGAPCYPFVTSDSYGAYTIMTTSQNSLSFVHVLNNTYDTCIQNAICSNTNGTNYQCVRLQTKRAVKSETCGENHKFSNVQDMSYKLCQSGTSCEPLHTSFSRTATSSKKACVPYLMANDFRDIFRYPFNSMVLVYQDCPLNYKQSSTFMGNRVLCVKNGTEMCLHNNACGGHDTFNIRPSYSFRTTPYPIYFRRNFMYKFTKCDSYTKQCTRIFGKMNEMPCEDHAQCRSGYCAANKICSELPKQIPCGPSVSNPSVSNCPGYSHCVCANSTSGVCVNLCFAELADLHTCAYNHGVIGKVSPVSKMEQSLIPFIDRASSVFSLENGTCKEFMNRYYECMRYVQDALNLETHSLSTFTSSSPMTTPSVNDRVFYDLTTKSIVSTPLFSIQVNESYVPTSVEPIQLNHVDILKDSSLLMKLSSYYKSILISDQVVVLTMERMVGLIPRYKAKTMNYQNIKACGCCNLNVTNYLESSIDAGILLQSQNMNTSMYLNKIDLTIQISGFESIMGHDSFLNRNWYEQCDIILAPPQDIDLITLSIKNNMLILDGNSTTGGYSIQELEQRSMTDLFMVFTTNLPTKVLTVSRDVRDAAMIHSPLLDKLLTMISAVMIQNYNNYMQLLSISYNFTDCSMFNSTMSVKDYHARIFSIPLVFDYSFPLPFSSSSFIVEYDSWFAVNITNQYRLYPEDGLSMMDKLANPNCYSSYNSYLGVFHYNDVSQYWELILKDFMLFLNKYCHETKIIGPYIAPLSIMIICLMYIEPVLMSLFKTVGKNVLPLIPVPNIFMSILSASYIIISARFYYLRNLYQILKHFQVALSRLRIFKFLVHPVMILLLVAVTSALLFGLWFGIFYGILNSIIIEKFGRFEWTLQFDASLLALTTQFGFLSLFSILCLVIDGFSNRNKIRRHGFGYYFMFDDPFHLRVDIVSQILIFLTSILIVLDIFVWNTLIINRIGIVLFFLCILMIFGGNVMLCESISFLISKKWMKTAWCSEIPSEELTYLEKEWYEHMKDENFRELQETFANNLLSIENILCFEVLEQLEKKQLTLDDILELDAIIHSVNLSADSRNLFQQLLTDFTNNPTMTIAFQQLESIKIELVLQNILPSIFMPLKQRKEYLKWKQVDLMQKEANVVDVAKFTL